MSSENELKSSVSMPVTNYVAYYRVSTKKQKKSGLGLDAQKAIVEHYAKADGATVVQVFTEAESGKEGTRCRAPKTARASQGE